MKLDVKEWVAKVTKQIKEPVKMVYYNDGSRSVSGGAAVTRENISLASVVPSGYAPVLATLRYAGSYLAICYTCSLNSGGTLTYQIVNRGGSAITITPQFQILCVKV